MWEEGVQDSHPPTNYYQGPTDQYLTYIKEKKKELKGEDIQGLSRDTNKHLCGCVDVVELITCFESFGLRDGIGVRH